MKQTPWEKPRLESAPAGRQREKTNTCEHKGERTGEFFFHILFKKAKRSYQEFQTICINVPLIVNSPSLAQVSALPACSGLWRIWDHLRCSLVHNRKRTAVKSDQVEVEFTSGNFSDMICGDRVSTSCLKRISFLLKLRLLFFTRPPKMRQFTAAADLNLLRNSTRSEDSLRNKKTSF